MNIDQQYLKSHENADDQEKKGKETPASADTENSKLGKGNTTEVGKTYDVEGFKAVSDEKNNLKDEGMEERNGE